MAAPPAGATEERGRVYPGKSSYAMLPVDDCVALVLRLTGGPLDAETRSLPAARGGVLACDVAAPAAVPRVPTSIMDGFAVRSADGPGRFPVDDAGGATAGGPVLGPVAAGHVRYITTGAALPVGADSVVKVEDTEEVWVDGRLHIDVKVPSRPGANIRAVGSDTALGEVVLRQGNCVGPGDIGLLAALGISRVSVHRRPRVAIMSTGDELMDVSESQADSGRGQIFDCNRPMLRALIEEAGAEAVDLGIIPDDPLVLRERLTRAFAEADVVVTSGGVSRGSRDHVKPLLEELGQVHFGEMCMKPGKPTTFATIRAQALGQRSKLAFALPGNPVSCFVTFKLLVIPAMEQMRGRPAQAAVYPRVDVELASLVQMDAERPEYHRAIVRWENGRLVGESTGFQRSSRVASVSAANSFLEIPRQQGSLPKGTVVKALLLPTGGPAGHGLAADPGGYPATPTPWSAVPSAPTPPVMVPAPSAAVGAAQAQSTLPCSVGVVSLGKDAQDAGVSELLAWLQRQLGEATRVRHAAAVGDADLRSAVSSCSESSGLVLVVASLGLSPSDAKVAETLRELCGGRLLPNVADLVLRTALPRSPLAALAPLVAGVCSGSLLATSPPEAAIDVAAALLPLVGSVAAERQG